MALTPNERLAALTVAEQRRIQDLMWDAQNDLWRQIDKATASGATVTSRRLREIHRDITVSLHSVDGMVNEWAHGATRNIYTAAMDAANISLEQAIGASLLPKIGFDAPLHIEAMNLLAEAAYTPFNAYLGNLGRRVDDVFRSAQLEQARLAIVGGQTQAQMARSLRSGFEGMGIFDFTDKSGRTWGLKRYTEMVSRTVLREAETQGTVNRLVQCGVTLGKVSEHSAKPCDVCVPWQGRILDLTGQAKGKYPTMDDARAGGLWHPNCKHNLTPHVESIEDTIKRLEGNLGEGALEDTPVQGPTETPKSVPRFKDKDEAQAWMRQWVADRVDLDKMGLKSIQQSADALFEMTVKAGRPKVSFINTGSYGKAWAYVTRRSNGITMCPGSFDADGLAAKIQASLANRAARNASNTAYIQSRIDYFQTIVDAGDAASYDLKYAKKMLKEYQNSLAFMPQRHNATHDVYGLVIHEYGHIIHGAIPGGIENPSIWTRLGGTGSSSWKSIINGTLKKKATQEAMIISEYAGTNSFELFAEAWSCYHTGQKHLLSQAIIDVIEDVTRLAYTQ